MSRLENFDSGLYAEIMSESYSGGKRLVARIIAEAISSADADVVQIIKNCGMKFSDFEPYIDGCSTEYVDQLDELYFEKEELGILAEASKYFSAARLVSSCVYYERAIDAEMLSEAAYEAIMAKE